MTTREEIERITDEYGKLHEMSCSLNFEDGSDNGCDCDMKSLVNELESIYKRAEIEASRKTLHKLFQEVKTVDIELYVAKRLGELQRELEKL